MPKTIRILKAPTTCPHCNSMVARDWATVIQTCGECKNEFKFMSSGRNIITIAFPKEKSPCVPS